MRKCPICKVPLEVKDYTDSIVIEFYEYCRDGCNQYGYEEWCGNYKTILDNTELISGHSSSKTHFNKNRFIYKRKLSRLRKAYQKRK